MRTLGVLFAATVVMTACSDDGGPTDCDYKLVDGTCVGVTKTEFCGGEPCTDGVSCKTTHSVASDNSLQTALSTASSGDCITLAAGTYQSVVLPGGVSLLGAGAKHVTLSGTTSTPALVVGKGSGGLLRGFTVATPGVGISVQDTQGLRVEQVLVRSAVGQGIDARGADLRLEHVTVKEISNKGGSGNDAGVDATPDSSPPDIGAPPDQSVPDSLQPDAGPGTDAQPEMGPAPDQGVQPEAGPPSPDQGMTPTPDSGGSTTDAEYGIGVLAAANTAGDPSTITISHCAVDMAGTQGIFVHSSSAAIEKTLVQESGFYGVAIDCSKGCKGTGTTVTGCTLHKNDAIGLLVLGGTITARDNDIGHTAYGKGFARNVQLQNGALVTFESNKVHSSVGQGIVVDKCSGQLSRNKVESNSERGIVLQRVASMGLDENDLDSNEHAGITAIDSKGVTIKGGRVANTKKRMVVLDATSGFVGDGVQLAKNSEVTLEGVKIEGAERIGLLIDDAKGTVKDTTISAGEEPLVVQNAKLSDQQFTAVTDSQGKSIGAKIPQGVPFVINKKAMVSTLPLPLP